MTIKRFIVLFIYAISAMFVLVIVLTIWSSEPTGQYAEHIPDNNCPVFYTESQHGDINLPVGTIFGYPAKSGENIYDIIRDDTFIMSAYFINSFNKDFRCFKTEEEAIAMGYKKFLSNQAARKKARTEAEERLNKPWGERNTTDTTQILRDIDAMIGL